eukprot:3244625-Amphidinium_carterae.1
MHAPQARGRRRSPVNLYATAATQRTSSTLEAVVRAVPAPPSPIAPTAVQGIQQIISQRGQRSRGINAAASARQEPLATGETTPRPVRPQSAPPPPSP